MKHGRWSLISVILVLYLSTTSNGTRILVGGLFGTDGNNQITTNSLGIFDLEYATWSSVTGANAESDDIVIASAFDGTDTAMVSLETSDGAIIASLDVPVNEDHGTLTESAFADGNILTLEYINDKFYAGGEFSEIDDASTGAIAVLNSDTWEGFGSLNNSVVNTLIEDPDYAGTGTGLLVGGYFTNNAPLLGRVNSDGLIPLINTLCDGGEVNALAVDDTILYVGGHNLALLSDCDSKYGLISIDLDDTNIVETYEGLLDGKVNALMVLDDELLIGGQFTFLFNTSIGVATISGFGEFETSDGITNFNNDESLPFHIQSLNAITSEESGQFIVAGLFGYSDGDPQDRDSYLGIAEHDSGIWKTLDGGVKCEECDYELPVVYTITILNNGPWVDTQEETAKDIKNQEEFFNELGIYTNFSGSELFFGNASLYNSTLGRIDIEDFYDWQFWTILLGGILIVSALLACVTQFLFWCCGNLCGKSGYSDSISDSY
eukprot:TRINITY_DN9679_c0_g1_i1.p1 TRINITY_DN9679_c0_g1~~TRINITY_DN9679_c0_g1_i1.p1  ORF type:complete len:492 (-),score=111.41 TRINITY_DN9679_c0_g1_i1:54-1529(-)